MTWAEMMAMPDYPESLDLENNETDTSSGQTTPTPSLHQTNLPKPKTPTIVHNINVNYRHTYSVEKKNG